MWRHFILGLLGLALIGIAAPAGADNSNGECNRTIAVAMGAGHQVVHGVGDMEANCSVVSLALMDFASGVCLDPFTNEELAGIFVAAEAPLPFEDRGSPLGTAICTALYFCELLPGAQLLGVCPDFIPPE